MTYTIVDGIVLVILILSTIFAWARGFTREALSIAGWIIAILVAAAFAGDAVPLIEKLPYVERYLGGSCELLTALGFVAVFVIMMILMAIVTPFFSGWVQNSALSAFDGGLGALFGFARGILIVLLIVVIYDRFIKDNTPIPMINESRSYEIFSSPKASIDEQIPNEGATDWFGRQFENITSHCPASGTVTLDETANAES